jgi:dephospho-CoA kinase
LFKEKLVSFEKSGIITKKLVDEIKKENENLEKDRQETVKAFEQEQKKTFDEIQKYLDLMGNTNNRMMSFDNAIIHIDIDKIGHDILKSKEIVDNIFSIIGDPSVVVNGVIDRKKVGSIIFNDLEKYEKYYRYTEKIEYEIIDEIIDMNKDKKIFLDWIILDRTKYWDLLDYKILVDTDYETRKDRVVKRDNINSNYFDLREVMKEDYNRDEMDIIIDGNNISDDLIKEILGELK